MFGRGRRRRQEILRKMSERRKREGSKTCNGMSQTQRDAAVRAVTSWQKDK